MSADNYYVVRNHPKGGFGYVMCFDSDPHRLRDISGYAPQFPTIREAIEAAARDDWTEYGIQVHPECQRED